MDFDLTEQQQMIKDNAREFLEKECPSSLVREMAGDEKGYVPELWQKVAQQGWLALPFQREYGGLGGDFLDVVLILEEMGRVCFPVPFFATVVLAGALAADAGNEKQKQALLWILLHLLNFLLLPTCRIYQLSAEALLETH